MMAAVRPVPDKPCWWYGIGQSMVGKQAQKKPPEQAKDTHFKEGM
jgi:hypothetical protein